MMDPALVACDKVRAEVHCCRQRARGSSLKMKDKHKQESIARKAIRPTRACLTFFPITHRLKPSPSLGTYRVVAANVAQNRKVLGTSSFPKNALAYTSSSLHPANVNVLVLACGSSMMCPQFGLSKVRVGTVAQDSRRGEGGPSESH